MTATGDAEGSSVELPRELVESVRRADCVPFVGAGISRPSGMAGWADIVADVREHVSRHLGYGVGPHELDFLQVPQVYSALAGSHSLTRLLDDAFLVGFKPNDYHRALAELPVDTYVTTNWDTLLEDALKDAPFRAPVRPLYRDEDVANWSETQQTNVLKLHGTITDHPSIVFTEAQYLDRYGADSLLFQLFRVLLASRSVIMVGFSYSDPFVKLLFHQVRTLMLTSPRPNWFVTTQDRLTPAFREYLKGVGFVPVVLPPSVDEPAAVLHFLEKLVSETATVVDDRSLRARLLGRMLENLQTYRGYERVLRVQATLGPFGSPRPDGTEHVFESVARDAEEHKLHTMSLDLITQHSFTLRLLGRPASVDALVAKGYTRRQAFARVRAFYETMRMLDGEQFAFAPLQAPSDRNQWIAANRSVVESWKETAGSNQLYPRAMLREDLKAVTLATKLFDADFRKAQDHAGGPKAAREQLIVDLERVLRDE